MPRVCPLHYAGPRVAGAVLGSGHAAETQTSLGQLGLWCRDAERRSGRQIAAEGAGAAEKTEQRVRREAGGDFRENGQGDVSVRVKSCWYLGRREGFCLAEGASAAKALGPARSDLEEQRRPERRRPAGQGIQCCVGRWRVSWPGSRGVGVRERQRVYRGGRWLRPAQGLHAGAEASAFSLLVTCQCARV